MPEPISIITPVSREAYLEAAIRSVLAQTSDDWELYLLGDGAPEGAREIMERFRSDRVHVAYQDRCGVIARVRRRLTEAARGRHILLLDDDDLLLPRTVEYIQRLLAEHPGAGCIRGWAMFIDDEGRVIEDPGGKVRKRPFEGRPVGVARCIHPFCFGRAPYEESDGWWERTEAHGLGEDTDLLLKIVEHTDIHTIEAFCYQRRLHLGNMTRVVAIEKIVAGVEEGVRAAVRRRGLDWEVTRESAFPQFERLLRKRSGGRKIRRHTWCPIGTES